VDEVIDIPLTPILVVGFNRPDLLEKSLDKLRDQRRRIYISIDGPRNSIESLIVERCKQIVSDFKQNHEYCSVAFKFHKENLGCKAGVISAINWAFQTENELIILDDDIDFGNEFLKYCDAGLLAFAESNEIWHLSGWTPLHNLSTHPSIYMTRYPHIWGWATWKDRWERYDADLISWGGVASALESNRQSKVPRGFDAYWGNLFQNVFQKNWDTWDIQWAFTVWKNGGFALSPGLRLTKNIGFDRRATHTKELPINERKKIRESLMADFNNFPHNWIHQLKSVDRTFRWERYHDEIAFGMPYDPLNLRSTTLIILKFIKLEKIVKKIFRKLFP